MTAKTPLIAILIGSAAFLSIAPDPVMPSEPTPATSLCEDYIVEWTRRSDFRSRLPQLLSGEDPAFVRYVERLAADRLEESR